MKSKTGRKSSKQTSPASKAGPFVEPKSLSSYTDRFFASYCWDVLSRSTCKAIEVRSYSNCSIQVSGPITHPITITGSNDGVSFYAVTRDNKSPLVIHNPGIYAIFENVRYLKPDISENTDCSITLFATV